VCPGQAPGECVVNISEGRDRRVIDAIAGAGGDLVLDVHTDPDHHRSVLTLGGRLDTVETAARAVVAAAVDRIDIRTHAGAHPRLGSADVVPFVALSDRPGPPDTSAIDAALGARDRFARWAGDELALPCFLFGPERSLPEVRRTAFGTLQPATGPAAPHPTAGATCVGARPVLVAYNVWIVGPPDDGPDPAAHALSVARNLADQVRGTAIRSLGLAVGQGAQVSLNLIDTTLVSVADVYDAVAGGAEAQGCSVLRAELVGLCPASLLEAVPRRRWAELDLSDDRTIEARLGRAETG
jgi:glutamate formiminotransferase / 5-formyltetrahydrofolate cyclo-ligase